MKRKLTQAEKRARRERKKNTMIIFIHGKQKRVPRPQMIEGLPVEEFIARNADPIWLHQNEMWEDMQPDQGDEDFLERPMNLDLWKRLDEMIQGHDVSAQWVRGHDGACGE